MTEPARLPTVEHEHQLDIARRKLNEFVASGQLDAELADEARAAYERAAALGSPTPTITGRPAEVDINSRE